MQQNVYLRDQLSVSPHTVTSHSHRARVFNCNHDMSEEGTTGPTSTEYRVDETIKTNVLRGLFQDANL